MLLPFFTLAAVSPTRQHAFRTLVFIHLFLLLGGLALVKEYRPWGTVLLGHVLLITGIVEGSLLIGWRLTQLPKSLALEFLLVSSVRPWQIFTAEMLVAAARLALLTLTSLPLLVMLIFEGEYCTLDVVPLLVMPFTWGCLAGLALITWAYEPAGVRRWGQRVLLVMIVLYLLVGVLAGEHLATWLSFVPAMPRGWFLTAFQAIHLYSPFPVMQNALQNPPSQALAQVLTLQAVAMVVVLICAVRSAGRFAGHFHERHYQPAVDTFGKRRGTIGDAPLRWWAIRRVTQYAGWVNLWLAGGFGLLYAAYLVAGPHWPSWLGRSVFAMVDRAGGIPALSTALILLAAVPAAFQYGLWDSNAQERLKKLELLLLTRLQGFDYWQAACGAAWKRGKGYFLIALVLWVAAVCAGRMNVLQLLAAGAASIVLWNLYFALGFRAFSRGRQASGLGLTLTIGLPLATFALHQIGLPFLANLLPPGGVYFPTTSVGTWNWALGPLGAGLLALGLARYARAHCDAELRRWYDRNHGARVLD